MSLPDNKQIKDLFEGLLGREVGLTLGEPVPPDVTPRPTTAVYVDDYGRLTGVAVMDFNLTAYSGAALALVPKGGADIAIEEMDIPDSIQENAAEILNVLAAPIGDASGVHQRLQQTFGPKEFPPSHVQVWAAQPAPRVDVLLDIKGYGTGTLSVVTALM